MNKIHFLLIPALVAFGASTSTANEYKQRIEASMKKHGLDRAGALLPAGEVDVANEIVMRIVSGIHPETEVDGVLIPARTVVDQIKWLTGIEVRGKVAKDVNHLLNKHQQRQKKAIDDLCSVASDPSYSDEEFVDQSMLTQQVLGNSLSFYQELKNALPAEVVAALHERERQVSAKMVQEVDIDAKRAFAIDVADVMRENHSRGCKAQSGGSTK